MPASNLGYIQWYFRDWLLSRTRTKLDPEQCGAYLDILCLMYDSEDGTIEWDITFLARFCRISEAKLEQIKPVFTTKNGRYTHHRVQSELRRIERFVEAGRRGGKARWSKVDKVDPHKVPNATPVPAEQSIAKQIKAKQGLDPLRESSPLNTSTNAAFEPTSGRVPRPVIGLRPKPSGDSDLTLTISDRIAAYKNSHPWVENGWSEKLYDSEPHLIEAYEKAFGYHPDRGPA